MHRKLALALLILSASACQSPTSPRPSALEPRMATGPSMQITIGPHPEGMLDKDAAITAGSHP